jgi:hypothetical protein
MQRGLKVYQKERQPCNLFNFLDAVASGGEEVRCCWPRVELISQPIKLKGWK